MELSILELERRWGESVIWSEVCSSLFECLGENLVHLNWPLVVFAILYGTYTDTVDFATLVSSAFDAESITEYYVAIFRVKFGTV